jgi:hypothetical protein
MTESHATDPATEPPPGGLSPEDRALLAGDVPDPAAPEPPAPEPIDWEAKVMDLAARSRPHRQAQAEARSFADAVDRDAKRIPYGDAVVLEGPHGVAVVQAQDYSKTVTYWWTVVGGKPDRVTSGPELMEVLAGAANRGAARTE